MEIGSIVIPAPGRPAPPVRRRSAVNTPTHAALVHALMQSADGAQLAHHHQHLHVPSTPSRHPISIVHASSSVGHHNAAVSGLHALDSDQPRHQHGQGDDRSTRSSAHAPFQLLPARAVETNRTPVIAHSLRQGERDLPVNVPALNGVDRSLLSPLPASGHSSAGGSSLGSLRDSALMRTPVSGNASTMTVQPLKPSAGKWRSPAAARAAAAAAAAASTAPLDLTNLPNVNISAQSAGATAVTDPVSVSVLVAADPSATSMEDDRAIEAVRARSHQSPVPLPVVETAEVSLHHRHVVLAASTGVQDTALVALTSHVATLHPAAETRVSQRHPHAQ